jgi:death on curing protein
MFRYLDTEILIKYLQLEGFYVKDAGLLDAAVNRPRASVFGEDAYPTLALKAAAQTQSIIKNHPMVDGNKRSSWFALNSFLVWNRHMLVATKDEAFDFVIAVATDLYDLNETARWIENHMVSI